MEMMEAGIVSLDTHPDPKLATVPTAHPFQRLSHRPHARRCNWSRAVAHRSRAPALSAGSRGPGGRSAPFVARVALGVLALPDYRRPVASAGAGVVALGLRALSSAVQLHIASSEHRSLRAVQVVTAVKAASKASELARGSCGAVWRAIVARR